jgi:hypothetical protein
MSDANEVETYLENLRSCKRVLGSYSPTGLPARYVGALIRGIPWVGPLLEELLSDTTANIPNFRGKDAVHVFVSRWLKRK